MEVGLTLRIIHASFEIELEAVDAVSQVSQTRHADAKFGQIVSKMLEFDDSLLVFLLLLVPFLFVGSLILDCISSRSNPQISVSSDSREDRYAYIDPNHWD